MANSNTPTAFDLELALLERGIAAVVLESLECDLSEPGRLDAVTYRLESAS